MTGAAESAAEQLGVGEGVEVDARCTGRSGGDACVRLSRPLLAVPPGATALIAHPKLSSLKGKDARQAGTLCITRARLSVLQCSLQGALSVMQSAVQKHSCLPCCVWTVHMRAMHPANWVLEGIFGQCRRAVLCCS